MIPNVVKGRGFRGLANYLLVGRKNARILAGNMVGRDPQELAREFGICRRLRPHVQSPVLHHTLSFADGEDPGDEKLPKIAESYIRKMGLEGHQWVAVVHRDKPHVHIHLAINRIGFEREWWNATHDHERAQVIAAQVELEFGLVEVPRVRLRSAIQKSIEEQRITPPAMRPDPPVVEGAPKTVIGDLRLRLETIPFGLPAPDWIQAAKAAGVTLRPTIGGTKVSGFTAALAGHRAVKLSDVHRSLSWPNLLKSGRVLYDPESHFDTIAKLNRKETPDAQERPDSEPVSTGPPAIDLDPDFLPAPGGGMAYRWQPIQPGLVAGEVGESVRANTPRPVGRSTPKREVVETLETDRVSAPESRTPGSSAGAEFGSNPADGLLGDGGADLSISFAQDVVLELPGDGSGEYFLGFDPQFGPGDGGGRDSGLDAQGTGSRASRQTAAPPAMGGLPEPDRGGLPGGRLPHAQGLGGQGDWTRDPGGVNLPRNACELIGVQEDCAQLGLQEKAIPPYLDQAASMVIAAEEGELLYPGEFGRKVRGRQDLWKEAERKGLTAPHYRQAKALVASVADHLEPARAVLHALTQQAKQNKPVPSTQLATTTPARGEVSRPEEDLDLAATSDARHRLKAAKRANQPKRFPARHANSLVGFKVDQKSWTLPPSGADLRADRAAAFVVSQEAEGLLYPRHFGERVQARLHLWEELDQMKVPAEAYAHEKALIPSPGKPAIFSPMPPTWRTPVGYLGWKGDDSSPCTLVGVQADWEDSMDPEDAIPLNLQLAARRLVARKAGVLLNPIEFVLRSELRESLWEEAEKMKLTPNQYRQVRDTLLENEPSPRISRTVLKALVVNAVENSLWGPSPALMPQGNHAPAEAYKIDDPYPEATEVKKPKQERP